MHKIGLLMLYSQADLYKLNAFVCLFVYSLTHFIFHLPPKGAQGSNAEPFSKSTCTRITNMKQLENVTQSDLFVS